LKKLKYLVPVLLFIAFCTFYRCTQLTSTNSSLPVDLPRNSTSNEAAHFAWDVFMSINEPADDNLGTSWENYKEAFDIFLPDAEKPTPWGESTPSNNPPCEGYTSGKVLRTTSKVSTVISETNQAVGGVLIDRNSNLVHYEVYMNKPMFEYLVKNTYYNAIKQAGSKIDFPTGSMELKAAWRILDPAVDDVSRYHTAKVVIYIPDSKDILSSDCIPDKTKAQMEICSEKLVGLVGLHIVYKTPSNPSFTWVTFEQIDNVETNIDGDRTILPSFRNKSTVKSYCPDNSRQCDCPDQETSQITRQTPIPDWVETVNETRKESLQKTNSIWQYYQLIGIQWAKDDTRTGNPLLQNLANTSMETFNQTGSSCVGCHAFARTTNPKGLSDFSWVMGRAQNPKTELPEASKGALIKYVMRENPYKSWGTFPNSIWNVYDKPTPGENPHGKTIRIYANDIALDYYNKIKRSLPESPELPVGSIVLKENYRTAPGSVPHPSDLVELTAMYKTLNSDGQPEWYWMKSPPFGPPDVSGFKIHGCVSCHMNWEGNGDGMLSFNFGKRPVITETAYFENIGFDILPTEEEIEQIRKMISEIDSE
jgi:hypothetical protein